MTILGKVIGGPSPASIALKGTELILDADADTTITADTDDQIDFKIAGADDFRITANTVSVLSGTTLNIDSGATIANSGTATGFADLTSIADGSAGSPSIANSGDTNTGLYFPAADTVGVVTGGTEKFRFGSSPIHGANKNVLINGGMQVCQRSTSTSGVGEGDTGYVGPDQWYYDESGTTEGIFTISQEDNGGTNGQDLWMKVLCTTEEALGATSDMIQMMQRPEAQNCVRLLGGSSGIAETTVSADIIIHADGSSGLSFPVKVAFSIHTQDGTGRQCTGDVSIAANDTWERVSVTFPSDSTATFDANNALGCTFSFSICGGSARQATNLTWANDDGDYLTSATDNIADQANNYIGITNVQWEVGAVPTSFAYEDYGTTLFKCQRYFERIGNVAQYIKLGEGHLANTTTLYASFGWLGPEKRAAPTMSQNGTLSFNVFSGTSGSTAAFSFQNKFRGYVEVSGGHSMTGGQAATLQLANNATDYIDVSAEL